MCNCVSPETALRCCKTASLCERGVEDRLSKLLSCDLEVKLLKPNISFQMHDTSSIGLGEARANEPRDFLDLFCVGRDGKARDFAQRLIKFFPVIFWLLRLPDHRKTRFVFAPAELATSADELIAATRSAQADWSGDVDYSSIISFATCDRGDKSRRVTPVTGSRA